MIIGENFEVLQNLLITHKNRIDIIYIDPPYNTGGTNLGYKDKFSKNAWLNLMKQRMEIAYDLLTDDGVIFISLDDNMQAYFKVMMDSIFGEENFIGNILWQTNNSVMKNVKYIRQDFEYILIYAKNKQNLTNFNRFINQNIKFQNPDNDPKGDWFSANATYKYKEGSPNTFEIIPPGKINGIVRTWKFSKEDYLNNKISLYFNNDNVPRLKLYKSEYDIEKPYSNLLLSIQKYDEINSNEFNYINITSSFSDAKNGLISILGKNDLIDVFTPKPVDVIKFIINLCPKKDNQIILDFFAGSGTTGQAVWELNKQDQGNRQFILCTKEFDSDDNNKVNDIGYGVCFERLYRISTGKSTNNESFEWLKKNEPFNKSLDVYSIKHVDISINKNAHNEYLNEIDFSIYNTLNPKLNLNKDNAYSILAPLLDHIGEE